MAHTSGQVEVSAGAVVVCHASSCPGYLLILDGHGNWGFPKGHQESGETLEETARRELREETGITADAHQGALGSRQWVFDSAGRAVTKVCHFFLFETSCCNAVPQTAEGIEAVEWLPFDAALARLTFETSRSVLRAAERRSPADAPQARPGAV